VVVVSPYLAVGDGLGDKNGRPGPAAARHGMTHNTYEKFEYIRVICNLISLDVVSII